MRPRKCVFLINLPLPFVGEGNPPKADGVRGIFNSVCCQWVKGYLYKKGERGFAFLVAMFLIVVFAIMGMATVSMLTGATQMLMDSYNSQRAYATADAGINYIIQQLIDDSDWSDNTSVTKTFGDGDFTISFISQTATTATARSTSTINGVTRTIQQALTKGNGHPYAFDKAIYTEADISITGSSTGTVNGNVSAGTSINNDGGVVINGDQEVPNTTADVPVPDWNYWQNLADTTISGNYTFAGGTYNGIIVVNGDVTMNQDIIVNGTLVVRGKVDLEGSRNITFSPTSPNPAIIAESSVRFAGTSNVAVNGWVASQDTITMTGTTDLTLTGGMIAQSSVIFTGNSDSTINYNSIGSSFVGFTGGEGNEAIVYGQWEEVY